MSVSPPARPRHSRGLWIALAAGALGAAVSACGEPAQQTTSAGEAVGPAPTSAPTVVVAPGDGSQNVPLDAVVKVTVADGQLDTVIIRTGADPAPLGGALSDDRHAWTSAGVLDPASQYVVVAVAHNAGGSSAARATFVTAQARKRLVTDVTPGDGQTVGVGMPIILQFNAPVAADNQANLVNHITVSTSVPVLGGWHWFSPTEVHWRPATFWPAHTQVAIVGHFRGVRASGNVWGLADWSSGFTVGDKQNSVIDAATHQMQVFKNDQLVGQYPVSTGVDNKSPTLSGTLFVWYKLQKVRMVSTSIGIPVNAPGGYDEDVFYDTAISTDGFYIHSAPWSVWAQGHRNVSHGCVNLSPANAVAFFNLSQVGDVVVVQNTSRVADYSDGEADWQIPWAQWVNTGGVTAAPSTTNTGGGL